MDNYVDGFVQAVPTEALDAYREMAETAGEMWMEHGTLETVDEVYEPDRDSEDRSTVPLLSETSGESGSHIAEPAATANRDGESVYLEERNRLLQQKVRSQI